MAFNDPNPYSAPSADAKQALPQGSPVKAVLAGVAVDLGGSIVLGLGIGIAYGFSLAAQGLKEAEIVERLQKMPVDSPLNIAGMALGLLLSLAGGYVCAIIAKRDEFRVGAVQAAIVIGFGLLMGSGTYSIPVQALISSMTLGAVMTGIWLGAQSNQARAS